MINMTRNKIPKAMHKYNNQDGPTRQSVQIDSASENEKKKQKRNKSLVKIAIQTRPRYPSNSHYSDLRQ